MYICPHLSIEIICSFQLQKCESFSIGINAIRHFIRPHQFFISPQIQKEVWHSCSALILPSSNRIDKTYMNWSFNFSFSICLLVSLWVCFFSSAAHSFGFRLVQSTATRIGTLLHDWSKWQIDATINYVNFSNAFTSTDCFWFSHAVSILEIEKT